MKDLATVFSDTFGNRSKFKILEALSSKPFSVNDISRITGLEQTNVSHNLKQLSDSRIVSQKIKGRNHIYYLNGEFTGLVGSVLKSAKRHQKVLKGTAVLALLLFLTAKTTLTQEIGPATYQSSLSLFTYFKLMAFN